MKTRILIMWQQFLSFTDKYPGVFIVAGIICLLIGFIINSSQKRNANMNGWVISGIVLFMVGLFRMTGTPFMSF